MQQTISVRDLSDFAGACNEFSGDDIAFRDLLAHRIVPLRCVQAGIRCLLTRQDVIGCISIAGSEIVGHACGMTCEKVGGVELLRAGEGMIGIHVCALLHSPERQLLVTSRQRHDARMWESLLTFATSSQSCDRDEAVAVMRLIAPHLHSALLRVGRADTYSRPQLTRAERRVAKRLLRGQSNKEIARSLGKSDATVRNQLHSLFKKLGVSRRSEAIASLRLLRLDEPPSMRLAGRSSTDNRHHSVRSTTRFSSR